MTTNNRAEYQEMLDGLRKIEPAWGCRNCGGIIYGGKRKI